MRSLDPDEAALWARVTASIRPLSREPVDPVEEIAVAIAQPPVAPTPKAPTAPRKAVRPPAPSRPGTTLDGSWDRRLAGGSIVPDRTLDLHGYNLGDAWSAIDRTLALAIDAGDRVVLLITGHHRPGDPPVVRGRIRAALHDWLAVSRHAAGIAAVRAAHRRHGGGGSLYIVLRRRQRA